MNDEQMSRGLRAVLDEREAGRVPDFDEVFAAAKARVALARRRRIYASGIAAAAVVLAVVMRLTAPQEPDWQYVDPEQFASSTSWEAPSDVLLPEHRVDLFEEIPVFIESTTIDGGSLL